MEELYFWDYECLPELILILYSDDICENVEEYEKLLKQEHVQILLKIKTSKDAMKFMRLAVEAIKNGKIEAKEFCSASKVTDKVFLSAFVEPVSFFDWAKRQRVDFSKYLNAAIDNHRQEIRIKHYKDFIISKDDVNRKMQEPLWLDSHAIMYLHGFEPAINANYYRYGANPNEQIIESDPDMSKIKRYIKDANKIRAINLYDKSYSASNDFEYKVKPKEFMKWAGTLGMDFPNLVSFTKNNKENAVTTKSGIVESLPYVPAYMEFMFKAVKSLNLSQDKRTDKNSIKIWLDENWPSDLDGKSDRTIEYMATFLRRPEDKKGGNTAWK